ncbi:MAG: hypothetical protein U9Q37_03475 [Euryarchaeota archaeon]|nr:hypothetical protein [Euryarchaeota archaeon]
MSLRFNREENQKERLAFIKRYSEWVKSVPNEIWSKQQAVLINSLLMSSKDFQLDRKEFLMMKNRSKTA